MRALGRTPAPFAGDDLIMPIMIGIAHDDRLEYPPRLDRFGKLVKRIVVERLARLVGQWPQSVDFDHPNAFGRCPVKRHRCLALDFAEQRGQAPAKPGRALLQGRDGSLLAHAAAFCRGSRAISSRASAI